MRTLIGTILLFLLAMHGYTQNSYTIQPVKEVNTPRDEILCGSMMGQLLISTNDIQDLVNDYEWDRRFTFRMIAADRMNSFSELQPGHDLLPFRTLRSEGTATFDPVDSVIYFSTSENYNGARGKNLKIYSSHWDGIRFEEPKLLPFCVEAFNYAHPYFDADRRLLVFSSDRPGSVGSMDIWYAYLQPGHWTEPVNPGILVNTTGQELFPTVFGGDIYYASNGVVPDRGFELFRCDGSSQWKSGQQLPDPINSPGDDVMIVFINQDKGYVTSNRPGGVGGDDIYLFERFAIDEVPVNYSVQLVVQGTPRPSGRLLVSNDLGEIVIDGTTNEQGTIPLSPLRMNRKYRFAVAGIDPSLYPECELHILDELGNRLRTLRLNAYGWAELELLPFDYRDISLFPNPDNSLLTIGLSGQLLPAEDAVLARSEPITILDEQGRPVAVAWTNAEGKFSFDQLTPNLSYTFRLGESSKADQVVIIDNERTITLPVLEEEALYRRLDKSDAIALVNERNETIYVDPEDLFVINRIYYSYKSSELTSEARAQLDQLAAFLTRNVHVRIELSSHTDSRGSDEANLKLSDKRARAVREYLRTKGVDPGRIEATGRGEKELINSCSDGVTCSEQEHAVNRRTEIRFISEQPE